GALSLPTSPGDLNGVVSQAFARLPPSTAIQGTQATITAAPSASALLTLLSQWRRDGVLEQRLCTIPDEVLTLWLERVVAEAGSYTGPDVAPGDELGELQRAVALAPPLLPPGRTALLVRPLVFAFRVLQAMPIGSAELRQQINARLPLPEEAPSNVLASDDAAGHASLNAPPIDQLGVQTPNNSPDAGKLLQLSPRKCTHESEFELDVPCAL